MKQYLEAGEFVTTHGVRGELKLYPWADGPKFIAGLPRLFLRADGGRPVTLEAVRAHKGLCIVKLAGVDTLEDARVYVRKVAYFDRRDAKLPKGRYFVQDILGCRVVDADSGAVYGTVAAVDHPAASDVYTVKNEAGETFLFPAVPEFLLALDPEEGTVTVRPIPGMFTSEVENGDAD